MQRTIYLTKNNFIFPPVWLPDNVHYEVITGSVSYAVSDDLSDEDIVGWCIPRKDIVFPHLAGEILNFGRQKEQFDQFQQHGIEDKNKRKNYDITIYNIVRYFHLCMECNPNMIDTLFTPQDCVLHCSKIAQIVRDNRKLFLHKGYYHKARGYAFSQLHKIRTNVPTGKRTKIVEEFGWDVKFGYHLFRLLDQAEQVLEYGDLDIRRGKEQMKAIRRGDMTKEDLINWFELKEKELEKLYHKSSVQHSPDEDAIKQVLLQCLEQHYGSLDKCIVNIDKAEQTLREIRTLLDERGF
jgi:predicted nucleotidyltransferase